MSKLLYYEGLSCPVCKRVFNKDEDIVACPQCGLPHHRACWIEIGHCHLADKHGTEEQWSRAKAETAQEPVRETTEDTVNENICNHCHTRNKEYAEFCNHCGAPLDAADWTGQTPPVSEYSPFRSVYPQGEIFSDSESMGTATARELATVVGGNTTYYIPRFRRIATGSGGGWNMAAFLFGPYWLLYRKQYLYGILLFLLQTVYDFFSSYWSMPMTMAQNQEQLNAAMEQLMADPLTFPIAFLSFILIFIHIALGLKGNELYKHSCERRIAKAKENTPDLCAPELTSIGGTSAAAVVACIFVHYVISAAVSLLLSTTLAMIF